MRGRRRSNEWPPSRDPHLDENRGDAVADEKCDEALRALARLLARQTAREIFDRESTDTREDHSTPEDLQ
jgi:hypothetical protein